MSEQEFRVEITGNIKVYIPIKKPDPWVDRINAEWDALIDEVSQRGQISRAITYPECLYPLRAA